MPRRKNIRIQIRPEDIACYGKFLLISERLALEYLKELYAKIQTHLEGEKFFQLEDTYEKTETLPQNGKKYHFFRVMKDASFIGASSIDFWRINENKGGVVGKEISI